ncbi:MAG: hypothetical protein EA379_02590 [Phycisphaerales bacterium]|nr:MAG: hypothetical protein EA379_02590 [Phycisphaerales bacterium]
MTHEHTPDRDPAAARASAAPCPYCGHVQTPREACIACRGLFEPLSRQATQNSMGPWRVRDESQPFLPGCSYDVIRALAAKGRITSETVIRGPTTRQFWAFARDIPGVAHLLGECHQCHAPAKATDRACAICRAAFAAPTNRQSLGLAGVDPVPTDAPPRPAAAHGGASARATRPAHPGAAPAQSQALPFARDFVVPARRPGVALNAAILVSIVLLCGVLIAWGVINLRGDNNAGGQAGGEAASTLRADAPSQADDEQPAAAAEGDPSPAGAEAAAARRIAQVLEDLDESDLDDVREAVETLSEFRATLPPDAAVPGLDAEIERLERRIDELTLRKFL